MNKEMYLKIRKPSLRYDYFLFFDTPEYLADQLFIKQKVRVWFNQEYAKEGSPFLAIFCRVKKKDSAKFLAALDALKNKMILCGYPEYEAEVQKMIRHLEEAKGDAQTNENDTSRETEQAGTAEISCG
ncbi:hypothetical protein ACTQ0G_03155 [Oscillospiraceae bacterium LCP21S3_A1]